MAVNRPNIKNFTKEQLDLAMAGLGEPRFRSAQIHRWLYSQDARSFEEMTTLGASLRAKLADAFSIQSAEVVRTESEPDKAVSAEDEATRKYLLQLPDGEQIESVLIPSGERLTVCVSSQAGCPLHCSFCATGQMGFRRNLNAFEITDQVHTLRREAEKTGNGQISNIVFMGMGEPLLNFDNVREAINNLSNSDYRFNIPPRRISISTVGLVPGINRLSESGLKTKLAVSLHSADQKTRESLIPVAKQYPLTDLRESLTNYTRKTAMPVTIVYMLLEGINDSVSDARKLISFAGGFLCKINLIDYNSIVNIQFKPVYSEAKNRFVRYLLDSGVHVSVRKSRGSAINAACGQLATSARKE